MTREEAISNVRSFLGQLTKSCQESIRILVPELAESEDERMRKNCIHFLELQKTHHADTSEIDDCIAYLERQKPAEWSEEDEKCIKDIISCIKYLEREDTERQYNGDRNVNPKRYADMIAKLESLRPLLNTVSVENATKFGSLEYERGVKDGIQSEKSRHWKPSEEQMDALNNVIKCELSAGLHTRAEILQTLYKNLLEKL